MGFMAGFGRGISEGLERNAQRKAKREDALLSTRLKLLMDNNANLAKAKSEEAANIKKAKALSGMIPGAPEGIWKDLFHKVSAGVSDNKILDFYKDADYIKDAPKQEVATPTVEAQTDKALNIALTDPTVDVSKPKPPKLGLVDHLNQRSNERMAVNVDNAAKDVMGEEAFNAAQQPFEATDIGTSGYTAKSKPKKGDEPKYLSTVPTKTNIIGLIGMANKAGDTESATYLTELQKAYADKNAGLPDLGTITTIEKWNGVKSQLSTLEVKPEGYEAWEKAFNNHGKFLGEQDTSVNDITTEQQLSNAVGKLQDLEVGTPEYADQLEEVQKLETRFDFMKLKNSGPQTVHYFNSETGQLVEAQRRASGGTIVTIGTSGKTIDPLGQGLSRMTERQETALGNYVKFSNDKSSDHNKQTQKLAGAAILGQQIIDSIVDSDGANLTLAGDASQTVSMIGETLKAFAALATEDPTGTQLYRKLGLENRAYSSEEIVRLAMQTDSLESKLGLLAFQIGSVYGTSGTAMSNKDLAMFMKSLIGDSGQPLQTITQIHESIYKEFQSNLVAPESWKSDTVAIEYYDAFEGNPPNADRKLMNPVEYLARQTNYDTAQRASTTFGMDTKPFISSLSKGGGNGTSLWQDGGAPMNVNGKWIGTTSNNIPVEADSEDELIQKAKDAQASQGATKSASQWLETVDAITDGDQ